MSEAAEYRDGPSVSNAPGSGASIESDPVTAGRREGNRQSADERSENQVLTDGTACASESVVHEDNGACGPGAALVTSPVMPEKAPAPEGGGDNYGTTGNERQAGGKGHSTPPEETGSAEQSDVTTVDAYDGRRCRLGTASRTGHCGLSPGDRYIS